MCMQKKNDYLITRASTQDELYHYGVPGMKWGRRKNYYGTSGNKFRASNGVTVGAPKNAGVAAFRKVQGTKVGGAALNGMAKTNTAFYGRGKNKGVWKNAEMQVRRENQAVREANQAHKAAVKSVKQTTKAQKKEFKADVKNYKKNSRILDLSVNKDGSVDVTSRADTMRKSIAAKKGKTYADKVVKQYQKQERRETVAMLATTAATAAGYAYLMSKYYS